MATDDDELRTTAMMSNRPIINRMRPVSITTDTDRKQFRRLGNVVCRVAISYRRRRGPRTR